MLRTINLRQIYCKIFSQKIDLRITATAMNVLLLCTSILCFLLLIFMTICWFHHDFRQMIPSTITNKICQNVAQSALGRNQFWIVFKAICPLLLSNSCLSSNLFNETFILENATRTQLYTQNLFSFIPWNSWRSQQIKCKFP